MVTAARAHSVPLVVGFIGRTILNLAAAVVGSLTECGGGTGRRRVRHSEAAYSASGGAVRVGSFTVGGLLITGSVKSPLHPRCTRLGTRMKSPGPKVLGDVGYIGRSDHRYRASAVASSGRSYMRRMGGWASRSQEYAARGSGPAWQGCLVLAKSGGPPPGALAGGRQCLSGGIRRWMRFWTVVP